MNAPHLGPAARRGLLALLLLLASVLASAQTTCQQIRNWSEADAGSFPVPELSAVSVVNDPGPYYLHLGTGQPSPRGVTLLAFNGYPKVMRNRTFGSSVVVSLASFADDAQARAVFEQDVAYFASHNGASPGWDYQVLTSWGPPGGNNPLVYYRDSGGEKMVHALRRYANVVFKITLYSDSRTDAVLVEGVAELNRRMAQAMVLIDRKCGWQPNAVPVIELTTSTGGFGQARFQRDMGMGVMQFIVSDADGLDELDLDSLKVYVAGVDKTGHFLGVVNRLAAENRLVYVVNETRSRGIYGLQLDTRRLMGEHNVFNISWNGDWDIRLRICDRRGDCSERSYRLYFGPYLEVTSFTDRRCAEGAGYAREITLRVDFGNNGHDAQAVLLLALGPNDDFASWRSGFWSAKKTDVYLNWYDDSNGLLHVTWPLPTTLPSGQAVTDFLSITPARAWSRGGSLVDMPAGRFVLVYGAMDTGVLGTPYLKGSSMQQLCSR